MSKFTSGAFVFSRARGLQPRDPEALRALAEHHGIDKTLVPGYAGDRAAVMRAITRTSVGLANQGYLLRPIKRTGAEVVYGIVKERTDEAEERVDHAFASTVSWRAEPNPEVVAGDHPVAERVRGVYAGLRGMVVADDWAPAITAALTALGAAPVRDDGRVYWVPPQKLDGVRKLGVFLHEVGIDLVLCEVEPETKTVVRDVAQVSLDEELERLAAEADAFDGKQKPSTYELRLVEYQRLQQRAILYRDALGIGVERAEAVLTDLRAKVERMLDVRLNSTVRRDGTVVEGKARRAKAEETDEAVASGGVPVLVFNDARFVAKPGALDEGTLLFVATDADYAVTLTLSIALKRWTPVGPGALCFMGQTDHETCLHLRGAAPDACASGLRALGFEIEHA